MSDVASNAVLQAFLDHLVDAWKQLLSGVLAGQCSVEPREEAEPAFVVGAVRLSLKLEGALAGSAVVEISPVDAETLTTRLAQRTAEGSQVPGQSVSVAGLLSQTIALAVKKLQTVHGRTLVTVGSGEDPGWHPKRSIAFTTQASGCAPFSFRILLSEGIVAPAASQAQIRQPAAKSEKNTLPRENLDRILGVALQLEVQLGRRTLLLRDVVELAAGSVIELDKRVQEPAALLLGGKVIARGEVVLSEGNYALRVTEICDFRERLESI